MASHPAQSYAWSTTSEFTVKRLGTAKISLMSRQLTKPEKAAGREPDQRHWYDSAAVRYPLCTDREIRRHHCAEFISEFGASGTAANQRSKKSAAAPIVSQFWRRSGQLRRYRQVAGVDARYTEACQRTSGIIGADHLKQRFRAAGGNVDTFKYQTKGITSGIPIVEFAFVHNPPTRRCHTPQVHQRCELERWDQQSVSFFRLNWRRLGEHFGKGASQCQLASDLRPASCVGLRAIRGPGQKFDHPYRRRGAAR